MKNLHQFLWGVKGRLPRLAILSPIIAGPAASAFGTILSADLQFLLIVAFLGPIAACLFLAYTYFALAIPLLFVAYLAFVFPEMYPALVSYSASAAVLGTVALLLGLVSEYRHSSEKKKQILERYGIPRIPYQVVILGGALGLIGVLVEGTDGRLSKGGLVKITGISFIQLFIGIRMFLQTRRTGRTSR